MPADRGGSAVCRTPAPRRTLSSPPRERMTWRQVSGRCRTACRSSPPRGRAREGKLSLPPTGGGWDHLRRRRRSGGFKPTPRTLAAARARAQRKSTAYETVRRLIGSTPDRRARDTGIVALDAATPTGDPMQASCGSRSQRQRKPGCAVTPAGRRRRGRRPVPRRRLADHSQRAALEARAIVPTRRAKVGHDAIACRFSPCAASRSRPMTT